LARRALAAASPGAHGHRGQRARPRQTRGRLGMVSLVARDAGS
jgi:hypothetical protein